MNAFNIKDFIELIGTNWDHNNTILFIVITSIRC